MNTYRTLLVLFSAIIFLYSVVITGVQEKHMVIIIPSYNNERWVDKNLSSVLNQKYENFNILYIDDCSTDKTYSIAQNIIENSPRKDKVKLIHNVQRHGALANLYMAIHSCLDDSVIVTVDGDDWLAHDQVLAYLNRVYTDNNVWLTYGQFIEYPSNRVCHEYSKPFSHNVIQANSFRHVEQLPISHLRTFYAWIFKAIKLEDLLYEEKFYSMTWDKIMMACMIEMSGDRHFCCPDVLYVYNNHNPISDHRVNAHLQTSLAWHILSLQPYQRLERPISNAYDEKQDIASCIIFAPIDTPSTLTSVCYSARYNEQIIFFDQESASVEHFIDLVLSITTPYVLIAKNILSLEVNRQLVESISVLKATQAPLMYICDASQYKSLLSNLPCIQQNPSIYALFPRYESNTVIPPAFEMTLWKTDILQKAVCYKNATTIQELEKNVHSWIQNNRILALLS